VVLLTVGVFQVPVIPLSEVVGKSGAVSFSHIEVTKLKVGIMYGFTVTVMGGAGLVHCPPAEVKVYVPVAVLLTVGVFQVPVIPLSEVVGKSGAVSFSHIEVTKLKVGVINGFTVTVMGGAGLVHCPPAEVNVYVPVAVLLTVGVFQVPVIPLSEVVGKSGAVSFSHIEVTKLKVGIMYGFTVTVMGGAGLVHCPPAEVKV
jgi:putative transposon-encoded protein